jgi:ERF superfamily
VTGKSRTTTAPETVPAGEPAPQPVETAPAPDPSPAPPPAPEPAEEAALPRWPLSVGEAIAEVTRRVEHIAKDRSTESGERYRYRGIDDVLAALHPILGDVGLVLMPGRITEHRRETRTTAKGATLNVALVAVEYRLIGPDGTETVGAAVGEAHDSGDKATQKALSQAYKTFALQTFSIPTEASEQDDPDRTNEPARPFTPEEQTRAQNALNAARDAETVEVLAGVRRRALHLLTVPTEGPGGAVAPLSYWIDARRGELEDRPAGEPA